MKKFLLFLLAGATALGLIGCSGDLHDEVAPDNLYIIGNINGNVWNTCYPMTKDSYGIWSVDITVSSGETGEFKFVKSATIGADWKLAQDQWGSDGYNANGDAKNFTELNGKTGTFKVVYNLMTSVMSFTDISPVSKIVITVPAATGYADGTVITITGAGSDGTAVDGSLFSWCGGTAVTLSGDGPVYEITANCTGGYATWLADQTPFEQYPMGTDMSAKLKIGTVEKWIVFKNGASYTFDWSNARS